MEDWNTVEEHEVGSLDAEMTEELMKASDE
jgi:hypothetical protein